MIKKELAKALIPLVNSEGYALLQEYVESRKRIIEQALPFVAELTDIRDLQGAYKELQLLTQLREWVLQDSADGK